MTMGDASVTESVSCDALIDGRLGDHRRSAHPTSVHGWVERGSELPNSGTHFGFVLAGSARLACSSGEFSVHQGMYFAAPGAVSVTGGRGLIVTRHEFGGVFHLGGPIEGAGRLQYIDGCSDSLLIPPTAWGDPCLNLLYVPPHTKQTEHTHPSLRVGVIASGEGICRTPQRDHPLRPGVVFQLPADHRHCFHTSTSPLTIVAFHPDSDFGPTDDNHPMLNRTVIPPARD